MSSIDERIVQMRFDNRDFEQNVATTMSTLEKLKEKLRFTKTDDGISNLKGSFRGFDSSIQDIEESVNSLDNRFSAFGVAGQEIIRRLTNAAIDLGKKLTTALTTKPVMDGFAEYEQKMGSIQTMLMGARNADGTAVSLEQVNQKLNELNEYADKTIYSFADMTTNISKFTNAGVSLDDSVDAIQGIANLAALSGSNAQQASHAMYNFAQALSSGAVKLIDWKSIQVAQMDTLEFKEALLDTALALKTVVKQGDMYQTTTTNAKGDISDLFNATQGWNESLNYQWITTKVLTETLARYSDEMDPLGKKATKAATEVKTFSQAMDTIKEALGTGWATSFEYIFGNFAEAKAMWTAFKEAIEAVIEPIADARNAMLEFWHDNGGRDDMINSVRFIWQRMKEIGSFLKGVSTDTFGQLFGKIDGQKLVQITRSIHDFLQQTAPSLNFIRAARSLLTGFFDVIVGGIQHLQRIGRLISMFWDAIEPGRILLYKVGEEIGQTISTIVATIERVFSVFENSGGLKALANGFANIFNGLMSVIEPFAAAVLNTFDRIASSEFVQKAGTFLADLAKSFEEFTQNLNFQNAAQIATTSLQKLLDVLTLIGSKIMTVPGIILDFIKNLTGIKSVSDVFDIVRSKIQGVFDIFGKFEEKVRGVIDKVIKKFNEIKTIVEPILENFKTKVESIKDSIVNAFDDLTKKFKIFNLGGIFKDIFGPEEVYAADAPDLGKNFEKYTKSGNPIKVFKKNLDEAITSTKELRKETDSGRRSIKDYGDSTIDTSVEVGNWSNNNEDAAGGVEKLTDNLRDGHQAVDEYTISALDGSEAIEVLSRTTEDSGDIFRMFAGFIVGLQEAFEDFKKKLEPVREGLEKMKQSIKNGTWYQDLKEGIKAAGERFDEFKEKVKQGEAFQMLSGFVSGLDDALDDLQGTIKKLGDSLKGKVVDAVTKLADKIGDLRDRVVEFTKSAAVKAFSKFWEGIKVVFEKVGQAVKFVSDKIRRFLRTVVSEGQPVVNFAEGLAKIYALFQVGKFLKSIRDVTKAFKKDFLVPMKDIAKDMGKAFGDIGKSFGEGFKSVSGAVESSGKEIGKGLSDAFKPFGRKETARAILEFSVAVGIVTLSLIALSKVPWEELQNGLITIGALMAAMFAFGKFMSFMSSTVNINKKGLFASFGNWDVIKDAAAILILAGALKLISTIDPTAVWASLAVLAAAMAIMSEFAKSVNGLNNTAAKLLEIGIAVRLLASSIKLMAGLDWIELFKGLAGLISIMSILAVFVESLSDIGNPIGLDASKSLILLAVSVGLLTGAVRQLGRTDWKVLGLGLLGLAAILYEIWAFESAMGGISGSPLSVKTAASLIVLSVAIGLLSGAVKELGRMDLDNLITGLIGLGGILTGLGVFFNMTKGFASLSMQTAASLIVLSVAIGLLSGSVKELGGMDPVGMFQGLAGVASGLMLLAGAAAFLGNVSDTLSDTSDAMIKMSVAVGFLAFSITVLGALPWQVVVQGVIATGAALFTLVGAAMLLSTASSGLVAGAGGLALMALALDLVIPPIMLFSVIPFPTLAMDVLKFAMVLGTFAAIAFLLQKFNIAIDAAAIGILKFAAAAAAIGGSLILVGVGLKAVAWGLRALGELLFDLLDALLGEIPFLGDWIHGAREKFETEISSENGKAAGFGYGDGVVQGITEGAANLTQPMTDQLGQVGQQMQGFAGKAGEYGSAAMTNFGHGFDISGVQNTFGGAIDSMGGYARTAMSNSGLDSALSFGQGFELGDLPGLLTGDADTMNEMMQRVMSENGFTSGFEYAGQMFAGYDADNPMMQIGNDVETNLDTVLDKANNAYLAGEYTARGFVSGFGDGTAANMPGLYMLVDGKLQTLSRDSLEQMRESGQISGEQYTRALADELDTGFGLVIMSGEKLTDGLADINVTDPAADLGNDFANELSNQSGEVENAVSGWGNSAREGLSNISNDFENSAAENAEAYSDGLRDGDRDVEDSAEYLGKTAVDGMGEYERDTRTVGNNFGYGLGDGMTEVSGYVQTAAANLARSSLNSMMTELDINSPSKETTKLGRFGGIGFGNGFAETVRYVKKKVGLLPNAALITMQSSMERLRDSLNFTPDMDPTISPVMDLSQIQNGMNMIGNMFGSQQFAVAGAFGMDPYAFRSIRAVTAAADMAPHRNDDVVSAVNSLGKDISTLKTAMEQMKFEVNGKAIGEVAYREVDRRLGNTVTRNRREGRG